MTEQISWGRDNQCEHCNIRKTSARMRIDMPGRPILCDDCATKLGARSGRQDCE